MIPSEIMKAWYENDLSIDIRRQWADHVDGQKPSNFPRDVGFPDRWSVSDVGEMVEMIDRHRNDSSCYVQVNSDLRQEAGVWKTCYIDLDAPMPFEPDEGTEEDRWSIWRENMEDVHWEMQKFIWYLKQKHGMRPRVYYSGSRGFSIHLDFPEVQCNFGALRAAVKGALNDANVKEEYIDTSVLEPNRICRLPYTLNWNHMEKRGLEPMLCLPLNPDWGWDRVHTEITGIEEQYPVKIDRSGTFHHQIQDRSESGDYQSHEISHESANMNPDTALERVQLLMDLAPHINDGRHRTLHFMLVPALIEAGWEDHASIHSMCEDFISQTGASYRPTYYNHVEKSIRRTLEGPPGSDSIWKPWSAETFLQENPELLREFSE